MALEDTAIVPVLAVDEVDRAAAFYRDKLGLEVERFEGFKTAWLKDSEGNTIAISREQAAAVRRAA